MKCLRRRQGFAKYRSEESAAEKKAIRIATFSVKVDAKNMGEGGYPVEEDQRRQH
jgi:hypothetical protein